MKKKLLSPERAFQAMFLFLQDYYQRTEGKAELGDVLGDIQVNSRDGQPADPAAWHDWLSAINAVYDDRSKQGERGSERGSMR
jgi:hypothetical protein